MTTPQTDMPPPEAVQLRAMQAKDIAAVYRLEKLSQPAPWPRWYFRKQLRSASCWVFEQQERIVGFGIVAMVKDWAHIMNMCVAPACRRRGLGRRMLRHLLQVAGQRQARYAWLEVRPTNYPAINLYRKLGFRKKQLRKNYYVLPSGKLNAMVMIRRLSSESAA